MKVSFVYVFTLIKTDSENKNAKFPTEIKSLRVQCEMDAWIGTSGFQYPEWKGRFYPAEFSAGRMLPFYAAHFCTTEINYTFRRIPSEQALAHWSQQTPPHFKFSFKAPQSITHFARLRACAKTIKLFNRTISQIDDKAGAILFQLPPNFAKDSARLKSFLKVLPLGLNAAFEFRHSSWFDEEIYSLLRRRNAALCIAETEEFKTPPMATADFGYLRLRREDYTPVEIKKWAAFVKKQKSNWRDVFIYFKHEDQALGPKFAQQMVTALIPKDITKKKARVAKANLA
jgi:uncharacterized protein YecE (DUF72 family)